MSEKKVWFITGSSSGLGRAIAEEALANGYRVAVTARRTEDLQDLTEKYPETALSLKLDVTNLSEIKLAIDEVIEKFGRIDVLVNNAGYGLFGPIEEATDEQIRQQFETNVFGTLNLIRAVLPQMRLQKSGHIINISSVGGFTAFAATGFYSATKFAVEAVSESLAKEVEPFGVKVTIVEPGAFRTDFNGRSLNVGENKIADYAETGSFIEWLKKMDGEQPGDPRKLAQALIKAVESENPPLRLLLGEDAISAMEARIEALKSNVDISREFGVDTNYEGAETTKIGG